MIRLGVRTHEMSAELESELALLDVEQQLLSLREGLAGIEVKQTNALDILGIESNERRLTRFLRWLLTADASHGAGDVFLNEFLNFCSVEEIDVLSTEAFFVVNREGESNAEIDIVLVGREACIGVEIKTTHQEKLEKLNAEYDALTESFPSANHHELVYLTFVPADSPILDIEYPTILWADLLERFEKRITSARSEYEKQLINDFITTIRTHVMTDFNGLSEQTELYLKYADAIDATRSAYEEDKGTILDALAAEFFSTDGIDETWERTNTYSGSYVKLYKSDWHSLDNSVNMELEPHAKLKASGSGPDALDEPYIRVRFDVEGRQAQTVRDAILERLGEEGRAELEAGGFSWFSKDESTYKFIGKAVPLSAEPEDYDPISASNEVMQDLRDIIEDPADSVAHDY